jgi:hypothetical protein
MAMFPWSGAYKMDRFSGNSLGLADFFSSAANINITSQIY